KHACKEMLETGEGNDDALGFTGTAACKKDVKWVVALNALGGCGGVRRGKLRDVFRRECQRCTRSGEDLVNTLLWQCGGARHIRPARFHRAEKSDQHFWFAMSERCDRRAISAEALCQIGSECIRPPAELAISQGPAVADMCDCFRGHHGPAIDS